jgi:predicted ATPase
VLVDGFEHTHAGPDPVDQCLAGLVQQDGGLEPLERFAVTETSLRPELLAPFARLNTQRSQCVVVTHSTPLVAALETVSVPTLVKTDRTTALAGQGRPDEPAWHWPER